MEKDWKISSNEEQQIMWENVRLGKFIIKCYIVMTYGALIVYTVGMFVVLMSHVPESNNQNITNIKPMYLDSKFLFETQSSPIYEIMWFGQFVGCTLGITSFSAFDGFIVFSILHLCGQLTKLQFDLKTITFRSQQTKRTFLQILRAIVKRHLHLQRLSCCIEESFNKILLVQMICYSITLCLEVYKFVINMTQNSKKSFVAMAFIVVFAMGNLMSLFLFCFIGEKLRNESENIYFAAYEMDWINVKSKESRMILNIMYAAKSPLQLTAGKFAVLSLEYFVLKTSMGYLSMLLAVKSNL